MVSIASSSRSTARTGRASGRAQDPVLARRLAESFGARLKGIRRERGWKQDAFAKALGVSRTTASNIERGAQRIFLDQAYRAAGILGVPISALLPPVDPLNDMMVVHAAADAPLTRAEAKTVARAVEDVLREFSRGRNRRSQSHRPEMLERAGKRHQKS